MHITITLLGYNGTDGRKKNLRMTWLQKGGMADVTEANNYGMQQTAQGHCEGYHVEIATVTS